MKQTISILLLMAMVFTLFTGCSGAAVSASAPEESQTAEKPTLEPAVEEHAEGSVAEEPSSSREELEERPVPEDAVSLPLDETETLTYWHDVGGDMVNCLEQGDYNNQPAMRYAEELTNVHIDNIITTAQTMNTDFQLMVASGDYDDLQRCHALSVARSLWRTMTASVSPCWIWASRTASTSSRQRWSVIRTVK